MKFKKELLQEISLRRMEKFNPINIIWRVKMPVKKSTKKPVAAKAKSKPAKLFYYRIIFDDNEKKNYMKSSLTHKQVEKYLKVYEKTHQKFLNAEFVAY